MRLKALGNKCIQHHPRARLKLLFSRFVVAHIGMLEP